MFSSINDNIEEIVKSQKFLDSLWDDEKSMQDTINIGHPNFISGTSDEVQCYRIHEENMLRIERIRRQLDRLREHVTSRKGIDIPHG